MAGNRDLRAGKRARAKAPATTPAPGGADDLSAALVRLESLAESFHYAHQGLSEALLRLPQAEEYEPLAGPLREFARVSPALAEALREAVQAARNLSGLADRLETLAGRLERALPSSTSADGPSPAAVEEATALVETAQGAVLDALATMPRSSDYARVAAQLRELALVSPSLMEWLREVPPVAEPLARAVAALRRVANDLGAAAGLLRD